jgi:hypothetical protein
VRYMTRKIYAWTMVILLGVVPVVEWITLSIYPGFEGFAKYMNPGILCAIAIFTGARLADAGYRRWPGVSGVFLICMGGPFLTALVAIFGLKWRVAEVQALALPIVIAWTIVLIAFVVWAGTRRSASRNPLAEVFLDDNDDDRLRRRIELRF